MNENILKNIANPVIAGVLLFLLFLVIYVVVQTIIYLHKIPEFSNQEVTRAWKKSSNPISIMIALVIVNIGLLYYSTTSDGRQLIQQGILQIGFIFVNINLIFVLLVELLTRRLLKARMKTLSSHHHSKMRLYSKLVHTNGDTGIEE